jgi:glycosyltransferase involved in cell wall biosynthesis
MTAAYSLATMLVFPSLHEGFGVPVIEAMACGVPVVTSNVSALPEVAGGAARLVDPYSTESIADGIAQVLQDSAYRSTLIDRGYARIADATPEHAAALTIAAYKRALETTS